jgi:hypothetical protein
MLNRAKTAHEQADGNTDHHGEKKTRRHGGETRGQIRQELAAGQKLPPSCADLRYRRYQR